MHQNARMLATELSKLGIADAYCLVEREIIPLARLNNISLLDALHLYADPENGGDVERRKAVFRVVHANSEIFEIERFKMLLC